MPDSPTPFQLVLMIMEHVNPEMTRMLQVAAYAYMKRQSQENFTHLRIALYEYELAYNTLRLEPGRVPWPSHYPARPLPRPTSDHRTR
jgi:hypothetical protein